MEATKAHLGALRSRLKAGWQDKPFPYLMCAPAIIMFCMFVLYPFIQGIVVSFMKWDGLSAMKLHGLSNYQNIIGDKLFWNAMKNTVQYAFWVTVVKNVAAVLLALFLARKVLPGRTLFRTAVYLPVTLSYIVIGILWLWVFNPTFGLLNPLMEAIGLGALIRNWLSDPGVAMYSVIWVDIWKWTGFHMVMYIAGLQSISQDYYEAAVIDGANSWHKFWKITVPQLNSTIFTNILLSITGAFTSNYALVSVMTGGGPFNSTEVAATYIVKTALKYTNLGKANAMSIFLFAFVIVFGVIQFKLLVKDDNYDN